MGFAQCCTNNIAHYGVLLPSTNTLHALIMTHLCTDLPSTNIAQRQTIRYERKCKNVKVVQCDGLNGCGGGVGGVILQ